MSSHPKQPTEAELDAFKSKIDFLRRAAAQIRKTDISDAALERMASKEEAHPMFTVATVTFFCDNC
jgi:hypothetical protein